MSTSYVQEFAKIASVDSVYDVYEMAEKVAISVGAAERALDSRMLTVGNLSAYYPPAGRALTARTGRQVDNIKGMLAHRVNNNPLTKMSPTEASRTSTGKIIDLHNRHALGQMDSAFFDAHARRHGF